MKMNIDDENTPLSKYKPKEISPQMLEDSQTIGNIETQIVTNQKVNKKYGNIIVCYDGPVLISIGPDYLCFFPTFICFLATSYVILYLIFTTTSIFWVKATSLIFCLAQNLSYLLMAISDPGIALKNSNSTNKFCKKCNIYVDRNTYHCKDCDICILQHDHHCPWTSKCIGKNNLIRFYVFLILTPVFMIFCMIAFMMCLSENAAQANRHFRTNKI